MVPSPYTLASQPPPSLARPPTTPRAEEAKAHHLRSRPAASAGELAVVGLLAEHAPGLISLALRDPELPADLLVRPLATAIGEAAIRADFRRTLGELEDGPSLRRGLRRLRHRHLVRIALREILRLAPVSATAGEISALAAVAVDEALRAALRSEEAHHGVPLRADGTRVPIAILGMGKLGGWELNIGSDVDLCFFHDPGPRDQPPRVGASDLSLAEFLTRVARRTSQALAEVTEDGFVFRVDLRLRPHGSRGALVPSLAAAERYYETVGRTWERAVLLRARPIAGDREFGARVLRTLRPFVFRREVDPRVAAAMQDMVRRARDELSKDPASDLKLGPGGIREVEFFVQALQLVWGGRAPSLQEPGTLPALHRLTALGYVTPVEQQRLAEAWELLRRAEHRVQCRAGFVTHAIPSDPTEREALAASLGFADHAEFSAILEAARSRVAAIFATLVPSDHERERRRPFLDLAEIIATDDLHDREEGARSLGEIGAELLDLHDPDEAEANLRRMARSPASPFHPLGRNRFPELAPDLLEAIAGAADRSAALRYTSELVLRAGLGVSRLLADQPRLTRRLVTLFGASPTLSEALLGRLDALGETLSGTSAPSVRDITRAHDEARVPPLAPDDAEDFVARHRELKRRFTVRIGMAYVDGELDLPTTTRLLSELADAQIAAALDFATRETAATLGRVFGPRPGFAVLGVGKLGGHELGFTSDLDLLFLREGEGPVASVGRETSRVEIFSRIAQRTMRLLDQYDAAGPGYASDARLRPSGSQGHLVVSLEAFLRYHREKAESWERLVLTRARVVASTSAESADAGMTFVREVEGALRALLREPAELDAARLANLRARMQEELSGERADRYNAKLGFGGLLDVELATQFTQLLSATRGDASALEARATLDALQSLAARGTLPESTATSVGEAARFFRRAEQALALHDPSTRRTSPGPRTARRRHRPRHRHRRRRRRAPAPLASTRRGRARVFHGPGGPHRCPGTLEPRSLPGALLGVRAPLRLASTAGRGLMGRMVEKSSKIWFNSEMVDWDAAQVHVLTHTLHYGLGVFEGIRCYDLEGGGHAIFRLKEHVQRLFESAHIVTLPMPYDFDTVYQACLDIVRVNDLGSCYVRPIAFVGYGAMGLGARNDTDLAVAAWKWGAYLGEEGLQKGIRAKVSSFARSGINSSMAKGKVVGHYVNSILAKREVLTAGYDEAILLDPQGYVTEASGENIFVIKNGKIATPPLGASILGGITRDTVLTLMKELGLEVVERTITRDELYVADEIFMVGTAAEVTPVREVDDRQIGSGARGPITERVQNRYFAAVRGDAPEEWLARI